MAKKKMKQCPDCGKEISQSAKRCPYCDAKQKKKLKIWQIIVAVIVIFVIIGSCGGGEDDEKPKVSSQQEQDTNAESENAKETKSSNNEDAVPEIEEQVIYEGNDTIITVKGIEKSGSGWNVKLLIENNSQLNLGFYSHAYAVNGIMTGNNIYDMDCDVAAGKKANVDLELKGSVLDDYGITDIRCIDVLFWAYDNDESFKSFDTGQIEIQTSLYDGKHDVFTGNTIFDSDGIKVEYLATDENDYLFSIANTTGTYIDFDFDEITINDYTVSDVDFDLFDEVLLNECQILCTVSVDKQFMQDNDIDTVKTIEWNLSIRPESDFFNESKIGTIKYTVE